ncbi:uncharacterized protein LOC110724924 isoform X2 [Chenopodium quinoa]|uniref:uncharacterized protein LOC110696429 isoform X2 n=1 Tax=Chenopodium quinoa TaxID=63459 RepID=UPI000B787595|nr:uncharacterized protein LOC110696429 isoform X2 [Chenopodium quinoa]XP_021733098.1 uncharacterized protein LOC110699909 isoform X2 [Chenopodium quinoa]XP_021760103.1 uncharacterized protein LOC110724923 isoform X2 [Chenopodium quinoa]XP_021760107.1 uncharacterized protein LOC110724924 isoform X2 [Chenopodium quinoa]
MITCGEVDSKGHLELREDPEAWIKNNPPSRLALRCYEKEEVGESIGELTQLIRLEFLYCDSLKCVSNTITRLHKLEHLQFYKCYCLEELPANIGQLVSLTHLKLDYCENIKFLPDSIVNLSNLTYLTLSSCDSLVELPANIGQLVSLTHLKLKYCKNIKSLPLSIANLSNLTSLSLFSCESLVELPANLDGLAHLCLLDIQSSKIKCLPWSITKLRKLRHLMLPEHFRLETLPYDLNHSVIISVKDRHVRKSWEELKTEIGELPIPFGGEIRNDAAQNPSIISPPGYLRLKEDDPSQWIINNRNLLMLVRFLDLENVKELTDSIMQFSELTHLYLYFTDHICLPDNYFVTFTRLTHLSLDSSDVEIDESVIHSLSKLSNLQTLHLRLSIYDSLENFNMPVSLKHLSLSSCNMRPLYDSLEKLTNLRSLDLNSCDYCESLPPCMYIHKLRLVDCSFESLDSLPIGLHHLEILFFKDYNDLRCIFEKCWNKLVNLETLSITCSKMEFFPEDIARLHNLQELQLKDCISLEKLPSNLHELVNLHTLDISVTRIKTLPPSFVKLRNLLHLILPKCFNFERLPRNLKQVSIIDDTEEAYYKSNAYDASLYQASASDESEDEVTVVPREIHETVPDEQTSADPFNSISMGSIEHITTAQGGIEQDNGENSHHDLENGQKQVPQHNKVERNSRIEISEEKLQQCWSENPMSLQETAEKIFGVSRSTLKRTIKELGVEKWPRKGRKQQPDAKKRKTNNTAPFESYCSQQNVVNLGSSAAHTENVQCIMGSDLHLEEPLIESHMDIQQQVQGHLEGALHTTESSGTIVVKATYKELSVRIVFSLTLPINQLIEEIGMKFQLELNKYRLLYQDEDKEWMMLTSVEDLKYASNVAESLGTKFVRLSVIDYVV